MKTKVLLSIIFLLGVYSCTYYTFINKNFRENYTEYNEQIHSDTTKIPFFKVHFTNGDVSVLDTWYLSSTKDSLNGRGKLFNFNRNEIDEGDFSFDIDDIAIIETNQLEAVKSKDKRRIAGLTVLTAVNVVLDLVCVTNPKACFGSCPTFYVEGNSELHSVNAEGFSSSIAPSLEKLDLDALQYSSASRNFDITMKNEAFETHMVNQLFIDAVPKKENERVFHDKNGNYYRCIDLKNTTKAVVDHKRIGYSLRAIDDHEYFSPTDSTELSTKEEIILDFGEVPDGNMGIVVNYRQTLLTTFLLYSGLSYMGDEVGDYFAKIETNGQIKKRLNNPFKRLGKIKFSIWNSETHKWEFIDDIYETGPIAKNLMIIPFHQIVTDSEKVKIKMELTKGLWRIDYVGLTTVVDQVQPIQISPSEVTVLEGEDYPVGYVINDDKEYLISLPGNEFKFHFELPVLEGDFSENELFLSSKGYYLEWMRQRWIENKDISRLKKMLLNDPDTWKELAKEFKSVEHEMEEVFWNSKYSPSL